MKTKSTAVAVNQNQLITIMVSALLTMFLLSCGSGPKISDAGAVNKYLQSNSFSNTTESQGKETFPSGSYQLYYSNTKDQVFILRGETYDKACENHDWWYLNKNGAVYHQIYDKLICYTKD